MNLICKAERSRVGWVREAAGENDAQLSYQDGSKSQNLGLFE